MKTSSAVYTEVIATEGFVDTTDPLSILMIWRMRMVSVIGKNQYIFKGW